MSPIIWYILAEIVCVVASTISKVVVVKGSKLMAAITTTIYYTVSALVTYLIGRMAELSIWVILITTVGSNFIGTLAGLILIDKFKKDVLWRVSATVHRDNYDKLVEDLIANNFKFVTFQTDWKKIKLIDVFSTKKEKSKTLGEIFRKYDVKYTISSNHHRL